MQERRRGTRHVAMLLWTILVSLVGSLAFGGWQARDFIENKLASREQMLVVEAKAQFVLDQQMAAIISQIAYLERKDRKTADEHAQLQYLRQQLEIMRKIGRSR